MKKVILLLLIFSVPAQAQHVMSVDDAIRLGLKNNYDIRIARNNAQTAANNKGLGTAGLLPTVRTSTNAGRSRSDVETNSPITLAESEVENWGAKVSLDWTIFDGFAMFAEKSRYREMAKLGEYRAREAIQNTVVAIVRAYYNLVQQQQLLAVARESRDISADRLEQNRIRNEVGGASSTDYLNAQVSYNADQSTLLNQQLQVSVSGKNLNVLLGQAPETPLQVSDEIIIPPLTISVDEILTLAEEYNSSLSVARQNKEVADRHVASARASFLPRLSLTADYAYSDVTLSSDVESFGGDIWTETTDAGIGLLLTFNLFNGGRDKIGYQNARLEARRRRYELADAKNQLAANVRSTYETFLNQMELVRLEQQNLAAARQNLALQQDRFRLGASSSLEFRDAQVNLIRAQNSLIVARYRARISRLEIDRLIGTLAVE